MIVNWVQDGKPDVSMAGNGLLAGLVAITAPVGARQRPGRRHHRRHRRLIVVFAVAFFDRIKIDDPVGAISVHGVCGTWGTLSVALFTGEVEIFWTQAVPAAEAATTWHPVIAASAGGTPAAAKD